MAAPSSPAVARPSDGVIALRDNTFAPEHVQLSVGAPAVGVATTTVTLAPGTYTIEVRELSLKDGTVVALDNHEFTVK